MENLVIIEDADGKHDIRYIATEETGLDKIKNALLPYKMVAPSETLDILTAYTSFVEYGAKDTEHYIFTRGNAEDWFIAQVEVKK